MNDDVQWAWFAGIFEGEGTITEQGANTVSLRVQMTDEDIILRAHALCGGTVYSYPPGPIGNKPLWRWTVSSKEDVERVLEKIMPYLGIRRGEAAAKAVERLKSNKGSRKDDNYCRNGHALTSENIYRASDGWIRCRECGRQARKRQRERLRS